jgi:hypothetical protein
MKKQEKQDIINAGKEAYTKGLHNNPYEPHSSKWIGWELGWLHEEFLVLKKLEDKKCADDA